MNTKRIENPQDREISTVVRLWRRATKLALKDNFGDQISGVLWGAVEEAVVDPINHVDPELRSKYECFLVCLADTIGPRINAALQDSIQGREVGMNEEFKIDLHDSLDSELSDDS